MGTDAARSDPTCPGREPIWTTVAIAADAFKATYHNRSKAQVFLTNTQADLILPIAPKIKKLALI